MKESVVFGIDVGGTTIKCGLFSTEGKLLDMWEIPTRTQEQGKHILPDIAAAVKEKIRERGLEPSAVLGLGIGVPGPVNQKGEVPTAVNLHWGYKNVAGELEEALGVKVRVGNDANVAALGEMWMGGGKGTSNLILLTLGTGVGGGVILDGKIVAGAHGAGGEVGHAAVEPEETEHCNCGNQGCLEQMASATGLVRLARKYLEASGEDSVLRGGELSAKSIFDAYKAGDPAAAAIVDQFAGYLGRTMAIFACVTDPEVFVLGGGVSKAGQPLVEAVEKYYRKHAFSPSKDTPIVLAKLGNEAGIYGAAKMVLDYKKNRKKIFSAEGRSQPAEYLFLCAFYSGLSPSDSGSGVSGSGSGSSGSGTSVGSGSGTSVGSGSGVSGSGTSVGSGSVVSCWGSSVGLAVGCGVGVGVGLGICWVQRWVGTVALSKYSVVREQPLPASSPDSVQMVACSTVEGCANS